MIVKLFRLISRTFLLQNYLCCIVLDGYKEFTDRKLLNPDLKTMISIGGFNEGSMRFSNIASGEIQRKLFAKNVIMVLYYTYEYLFIS